MKRLSALMLVGLVATALFGALVYAVLAVAHVSEPAATTVQGPTLRRLWATTFAALALVGVVSGALAVRRSGRGIGAGDKRVAAVDGTADKRMAPVVGTDKRMAPVVGTPDKRMIAVAAMAGLTAVVNGALNLATARGGPGSGNGVVGGAAALVLGVIAMALAALARKRLW